jgi:hypothetical protein
MPYCRVEDINTVCSIFVEGLIDDLVCVSLAYDMPLGSERAQSGIAKSLSSSTYIPGIALPLVVRNHIGNMVLKGSN